MYLRRTMFASLALASMALLSACDTATTGTPTRGATATVASGVTPSGTTPTVAITPTTRATPLVTGSPSPAGSTPTAVATPTTGGVPQFTPMAWQVGQQAVYDTVSPEGAGTTTFSVVGKEGNDWWFEMKFAVTGKPWVIIKTLVAQQNQTPKRLIMQTEGEAALELPPGSVPTGVDAPTVDPTAVAQGVIGVETKTVKAGTFTNTLHTRFTEEGVTSEAWVHATVPVIGIVASTSQAAGGPTSMELASFKLTGAVSEITGEPQAFPTFPAVSTTPR